VKKNTRKILFLLIVISSFSICFAEDFWTKLNWDYETRDIFYSSQDEIYINTWDESTYFREYRSKDGGVNWEHYTEILGFPLYIKSLKHISKDGQYLYIYADDSLFVVYKDSSDLEKILELNFMTMHKIKDSFFYLQWNKIYKSSMDIKDAKLVLETEGAEPFLDIATDSTGTLWAGSTDYLGEGGLYRSDNNGETWIGPEPDLLNEFISDISVDSEGRIFVGTCGGSQGTGLIYRSEDNGETWEKVVYHYIFINKIAINSDDEIFAGLENGRMIHSNDHGDSWEYIDEGLVSPGMINDMVISPNGYVYIATNDGVYRSINSTTEINDSDNLISSVELYQNYPNPFNNETTISFRIDKTAEVELKLFNTKGEYIRNIFSGKVKKSYRSYVINFEGINSGVYFYGLSIDGKFVDVKKMMFLK